MVSVARTLELRNCRNVAATVLLSLGTVFFIAAHYAPHDRRSNNTRARLR